MNNIVASRKLFEVGSKKPVLVRIGKPTKVSGGDWKCAFHISNIGMKKIQFAHGIDGFQAMEMAIEGSRIFLERTGKKFSWDGSEEGVTSLPRYVPDSYGEEFRNHLCKMIDSEEEFIGKMATLWHERHYKHGKMKE
jgi:hypothetical protein